MLEIEISKGGASSSPDDGMSDLDGEMKALDAMQSFIDTLKAQSMEGGIQEEKPMPGPDRMMSEEDEREILKRGY